MDSGVVGVMAALVLLDLAVRATVIWKALPVFERKLPLQAARVLPDETAEEFEFPTTDGLRLRGSLFWPPPDAELRGIVVFCPEFGGNRWSARAYAEALRAEGFVICSFDFRNQGQSPRMPGYEPLHWLTEYEVADALAAIAYVQGRADLRSLPLGLFGVSRGGSAALAVAARAPAVQLVATDGAFSHQSLMIDFARRWAQLYLPLWVLKCIPLWHVQLTIRLMKGVSELRRHCRYPHVEASLRRLRTKPVLMISGENDNYISPEITRELHRLTRHDPAGVWIVPRARHNLARQSNADAYDQVLLDFFSQLPAPARPKFEKRRVSA